MIDSINNDRQDIFKYQLELIKLITESWKNCLQIPHDLLYTKLNINVQSKKIEVGIQLCSIFLVNNLPPWRGDNFKDICKKLCTVVCESNQRTTYRAAAETLGLVLKYLKGTSQDHFQKVLNNLHILLKNIKDFDKYGNCIQAIVLHYPDIADDFHLRRLMSRLSGLPLNSKASYLKVILTRYEAMGNIEDFLSEKWQIYLENDNLELQLLSLDLFYKSLDILKASPEFKTFIESVCKHVANTNILCRTRLYDIAISVCQRDDDGTFGESYYLFRDVLVQGLIDNDEEIRDKVFQFWEKCTNIPTKVSNRFSYLLSQLYKTSTENQFLGYSSYLLLALVKKTKNYNEKLFEHPLEDCDFEDYLLQTNWRVRHSSVVPMFAETLRTFSEDYEPMNRSQFGQLRQTANSLDFTPTQSVREKQMSEFTLIESSLIVKSFGANDDPFKNPNLVAMSDKYKVPKRRFLRDKAKIHRQFANYEIEKSVKRVQERRDLAKAHENTVKIYRQYRKGDLPDIQIGLQALLEPLQALSLVSILLCF